MILRVVTGRRYGGMDAGRGGMTGSIAEIEAIRDHKDLQEYLRTSYALNAQVLAVRAAVRVMPLVAGSSPTSSYRHKRLMLAVFRALFFSWAASHESDIKGMMSASFVRAAIYASEFIEDIFRSASDTSVKLNAAASALHAASAVRPIYDVDAEASVIDAVASASYALTTGFDCIAATETNVVWGAVHADLVRIEVENSFSCLAEPLWPKGRYPEKIPDQENTFMKVLGTYGDDWSLVFDFYRLLRDGLHPLSNLGDKAESILVSLVLENNNFWERQPDEVMRDLAERLGGRGEPTVRDGEIDGILENLIQVAADFRFGENEKGAIDALPFSELARDPGFAGTTLSEAREKAQELADRLKRANAPGRLVRSVTRLLEALPEHVSDLNPALLRSRSRSLEADAIAYGAAGAEAELFPDAVSELLDVVGILNDLQGCFPAIAEVERNIAAIDIAGRENKVQPELSVISVSARELSAQYPHVMTEAAAEAVAALDADIADAADIEVKRDLLARSLLIKRNFLSAVYRKVLSPAGREALRVGKLHYDGAISGSVEGVKKLAGSAPAAFLAFYFTGPLGVLIILLAGQFKSLKDAKDVVDRLKSDGQRSDNDQD